jgi:biopolymer transport protein ExbD
MVKLNKHAPKSFSLDLVPMINVVFLLLIFFMLTSTGIQNYKDIELPVAQSSDEISQRNIVVVIFPDGRISLDKISIDSESLTVELEKKLREAKVKSVEIQADKNVPFEIFGKIIENAQSAGGVEFILTTQSE